MSAHDLHHDHHDTGAKAIYGFWVFLLSDLIMFAALFASYAVLHNNTFGAAGISQVASLPYVLVVTLVLMVASLVMGFGSACSHANSKGGTLFFVLVTLVLTVVFFGMQYHQLAALYQTGNSWTRSAFLSCFYTLIGMHLFHIMCAILWAVILLIQVSMKGLTSVMKTRVRCFTLFMHFLNILWLFIFVIVYLVGAI